MYFLETLHVCAPCHGGVLYSFDIDGMLFEFVMNFFVNSFLEFHVFFAFYVNLVIGCCLNFSGNIFFRKTILSHFIIFLHVL